MCGEPPPVADCGSFLSTHVTGFVSANAVELVALVLEAALAYTGEHALQRAVLQVAKRAAAASDVFVKVCWLDLADKIAS
jgi:hypothetical protein